MAVLVSIILLAHCTVALALIIAAVGRGGLTLARRLQSRHDNPADSPSLDADGSVAALTAFLSSVIHVRCKKQYLPMLPDHAELAAPEHAQCEAALARCGRSQEAHPSISILPCRWAPFLQPSLSVSSAAWPAAWSHQQGLLPSPGKLLVSTRTTHLACCRTRLRLSSA